MGRVSFPSTGFLTQQTSYNRFALSACPPLSLERGRMVEIPTIRHPREGGELLLLADTQLCEADRSAVHWIEHGPLFSCAAKKRTLKDWRILHKKPCSESFSG